MHHWKFGLLADAHGPIIFAFPISASVPYLLDSRIAGRLLVNRFVKQNKINSRFVHKGGFDQVSLIEAKPEERAGWARILGKADAAMQEEEAYGIGLCSVEEIGAAPNPTDKLPPQNANAACARK